VRSECDADADAGRERGEPEIVNVRD